MKKKFTNTLKHLLSNGGNINAMMTGKLYTKRFSVWFYGVQTSYKTPMSYNRIWRLPKKERMPWNVAENKTAVPRIVNCDTCIPVKKICLIRNLAKSSCSFSLIFNVKRLVNLFNRSASHIGVLTCSHWMYVNALSLAYMQCPQRKSAYWFSAKTSTLIWKLNIFKCTVFAIASNRRTSEVIHHAFDTRSPVYKVVE